MRVRVHSETMRHAAVRARRWSGLVVVMTLLAGAPVAAQENPASPPPGRETIDRVVALVDGEAILLSDVVREMNLARLQRNLRNPTPEQQEKLFREILQEMIDDQLLVAEARREGFEVGEEELRRAVDEQMQAVKQRLGGEEKYREELARQGLTEAEVLDMQRDQRRKQILASRVIQKEIRGKLDITDDQVRAYYETHRDSLPPQVLHTPVKLRLAHILVVPQTSSELEKAARAKIARALERVRAGEDFATVAKEMSEWPTASKGGFLGTFRYGDFNSNAFDEAVSKLKPGEISDILETRFGLMIVKLESRNGPQMTARHIVVKLDPDEDALVRAFERAQELRRRALAGEDFSELARAYSDDPNTAANGGDLGSEWVLDDLLPEFRDALDSLQTGEISEVVRSPSGFHIFKVLDRSESHDLTYEEALPMLRRYVEQVELEKRYREYVEQLRTKFYIDIKV